jgi:hypothetical protein
MKVKKEYSVDMAGENWKIFVLNIKDNIFYN